MKWIVRTVRRVLGSERSRSAWQLPTATPTAPRNLRVRGVKDIARTYGKVVSADVVLVDADPPADMGGSPVQGYLWRITGATSTSGGQSSDGDRFVATIAKLSPGEHVFAIRAFNSNGDGPAARINFTITPPPRRDPVLQQAIDILRPLPYLPTSESPRWAGIIESPEVRATSIIFGQVPSVAPSIYNPSEGTITIYSDLRFERLEALATEMARNLTSVVSHAASGYPQTWEEYVQRTVAIEEAGALVWSHFGSLTPRTPLELSHSNICRSWLDGNLESHIRYTYRSKEAEYRERYRMPRYYKD